MTHCDHDLVNTGEIKEGMHLYKCKKPGCEHQIWLALAEENVSNQLKTTEHEVPTVFDEESSGGKTEKQKKQSDYHKRRYQLLKQGQWKVKP